MLFLELTKDKNVAYITNQDVDLERMETFLEEHYMVEGSFVQEKELENGKGIYRFQTAV